MKAACRRDDLSRDVDDQERAPRGSIAAGTRGELEEASSSSVKWWSREMKSANKRQNMALQGLLYRL